MAGGVARVARRNQHHLGGAARRNRRLAKLRHPGRCRRPCLERQVSRPDAKMVCAALHRRRKRDQHHARRPAAMHRNSWNGAGRNYADCRTWWCRSSARSTNGWSPNFRNSLRSIDPAGVRRLPPRSRIRRQREAPETRASLCFSAPSPATPHRGRPAAPSADRDGARACRAAPDRWRQPRLPRRL